MSETAMTMTAMLEASDPIDGPGAIPKPAGSAVSNAACGLALVPSRRPLWRGGWRDLFAARRHEQRDARRVGLLGRPAAA
ncbi:hypothetical protein HII28_19155 [Planctomonas sp. JC2975]|uniref:hypothetical protein n=1 Tax=Planctomonas sp. JC2975 TaxID=2729626 RepID=UPI001476798F|nr:hypothetical protein [Planctomonas sp. JC2975]NNC13985.1 hypothetical protein [Planctomonas sp. JC2975]